MRQVKRLLQVHTHGVFEPAAIGTSAALKTMNGLSGYILEPSSTSPPPGPIKVWGFMVVVAGTSDEPKVSMAGQMRPSLEVSSQKRLPLRPIGRLLPVAGAHRAARSRVEPEAPKASSTARTLRPVRSGRAYGFTSPPARGLVRPELAEALETLFDRFARERGFTPDKPLDIQLSRGFKAGSHGHGEGRAVDIAAVGRKSLLTWKQEWDRAVAAADKLSDPREQDETIAVEQARNLGYGLYNVLQAHNGWRINVQGWRPYRGVMQLFGPWTATEGPWKTMQIENPNPYQQQRLADQQWVLQAHQDHIHVAK